MARHELTPLQLHVLETLADVTPRWTLTGGAALIGFHLGHRTTRDVDLVWRGRDALGRLRDDCAERLRDSGVVVDVVQTSPTFVRLRVERDDEAVIVDLVADPTGPVHPEEERDLGAIRILVDSAQAILAAKLGALLGRMEVRDLVDVEALLREGADLGRGLRDAARVDAGFSPLTLAWLLRDLDVAGLASAEGLDASRAEGLSSFRAELVARLLELSRPPE